MSDYNADDIYVLYNMINKPVLIADVNKLASKGNFFLYMDTREINIHTSISRLSKAGFIRENTPKEILEYLTVPDLKQLLNRKGRLSRAGLILEAESMVSDEEIIKYPNYTPFYVISDLGNETLTKYKNLILFFNKSKDIFRYREVNGRFNASYFFKNYTHDPLDEILNYYKDKNPEIAGRVSYIKEEYNTAIAYAIQTISKKTMASTEEMINRPFFFDSFDLRRIHFNKWIVETFSSIELTDDGLKNLIKQDYDQNFKYTDLFGYDLFEKIQLAVMINESEELVQVSSKVSKLISDKYFPQQEERNTEDSADKNHNAVVVRDNAANKIEEYYKKTAQDLALLDLLISHLDLELLYGLRDRVDIMINEWEEMLDIDEQTFFEEK